VKIHDLIQGSPEWLAYRATHFNASDAPAMMGVSPYKTRAELLRELHTGVAAEVDAGQQKRFDNGHRAEALARPLAEQIVGEDLYPVTGSEGRLSASFDGLTMAETLAFEHKALNAELKAAFDAMYAEDFREVDDANAVHPVCRLLPIHHRIQMEQQLHISGAERILFMASEWTAEGVLVEERHCWYYPDAELRAQILRGWDQFAADLAAYTLPPSVAPAPVGKAPDLLPALRIEVTGAVTASNLAEFKATALATIRAVNRTLKTDQDFADADKAVKWCADVESRLKAAKEHALSQTADIEALFRALDEIGAEAKTVRLDLDKLVTRRKTEVKEEAVAKARRALDEHVASLNAEIAPMRITLAPVDFAGAIKGLRSIASMQDALDTALAGGKIGADSAARVVRGNVATFQAEAAGFEFLFADLGQLVHKAADDFKAVVSSRIAMHKAAEAEKARLRADAEARQAEAKRIQAENDAAAAMRTSLVPATPPFAGVDPKFNPGSNPNNPQEPTCCEKGAPGKVCPECAETSRAYSAAMAPVRVPVANEPATLKLGDICGRLGFTVTSAFVGDTLHIRPAKAEGNRPGLYTERQFAQICQQLQSHVSAMAELYAGETA
jgi:predicted phage-related endonuclease